MLRKGGYPYKLWMIDKNSIKYHYLKYKIFTEKEGFYSHLNMEDITDADYAHAKRVCKNFEIKNWGEYHDLHVQSDTLFLADVFKNFRNICLEIYELDPAKFLPAPGLAWQPALKKDKVKLDLLTDIDILLMVEKGIREEEYVTLFIDIQKLITSVWKIMIKIKNYHFFNIVL